MTLEELIASQPDPRELKRALAVKMRIHGMKHREIQEVLGVQAFLFAIKVVFHFLGRT